MKITLNISPQEFGRLTEDIEYGAQYGYYCEVWNAVREMLASASEADQGLVANGMLGEDGWKRKQQIRLNHQNEVNNGQGEDSESKPESEPKKV